MLVDSLFTNAKVKDDESSDEPTEEESAPATLPKKAVETSESEVKTEPKKAASKEEAPKTTKSQTLSDDDFFAKFGGNA